MMKKVTLCFALVASTALAQPRVTFTSMVRSLNMPTAQFVATSPSAPLLFETQDGNELLLFCRDDSTVTAFVAHQTEESAKFISKVLSNAIPDCADVLKWYGESTNSVNGKTGVRRSDVICGWRFALTFHKGRMSRLIGKIDHGM